MLVAVEEKNKRVEFEGSWADSRLSKRLTQSQLVPTGGIAQKQFQKTLKSSK